MCVVARRLSPNIRGVMVTVHIGDERKRLEDLDESWVRQQVGARRDAGVTVCLQIAIRAQQVDIRLRSAGCSPSASVPWTPGPAEREIIDLWERCGVDELDFKVEDLLGFLAKIRGLA